LLTILEIQLSAKKTNHSLQQKLKENIQSGSPSQEKIEASKPVFL